VQDARRAPQLLNGRAHHRSSLCESADADTNAASTKSDYQSSRTTSIVLLIVGSLLALILGAWVVRQIVRSLGKVKNRDNGIFDITTEQFDRVMKTNLYAMFWLSKSAVHMGPGSTIINTAATQAYQSSPNLLDYATTKAGIVAFTKALAAGLAEKGIRVNAVAPGPIWTPLIPASMPKDQVKSFGEDTPMSRAGQPAELAPAYVFFASQESSYVTGDVLGVTGGQPLS
jgi:NAD(P)-dependent dehydrogenase (short-subunit alcohol dehydrogenase family)